MKPLKFLPYLNKTLILSILFLALFSGGLVVFADPPGSQYTANQILDPLCGPTDPNCSVATDGSLLIGQTSQDSMETWFGSGAGSFGGSTDNTIFVGISAGAGATSAVESVFIGSSAGYGATDAGDSNFIGAYAGYFAANAVNSNFLGNDAGYGATNAIGSNFIGENAGANATDAPYANFIGYLTGSDATNAWNSVFIGGGVDDPNSPSEYHSAGVGATDASNSFFVGYGAGENATNAANSNFFGSYAGNGAINADHSNFIGEFAGNIATDATGSNFIGRGAGAGATNASYANFIGFNAGDSATDAQNSNFVGYGAGSDAYNARDSIFIGTSAGNGAINASHAIFIGGSAGYLDTVDNTADDGYSILIGENTLTDGNQNSIAIGTGATNTMSDQFLIASSYVNWQIAGVDYVMPSGLGDPGSVLTDVGGDGTLSWEASGGSLIGQTSLDDTETWLGADAGVNSASTSLTTFIGKGAGDTATDAERATFVGFNAGYHATYATYAIMMGFNAGAGATYAGDTVFIGDTAGAGATDAGSSNFIGANTGIYAVRAGNSNFMGSGAGYSADDAHNSIFFGPGAGGNANNANNAIFIGNDAGSADAADNNFATVTYSSLSGGTFSPSDVITATGTATVVSDNGVDTMLVTDIAGGFQVGNTIDNGSGVTAVMDVILPYTSILIGDQTSTGGNENSIALGAGATNTSSNQFMIGSALAPIDEIDMITTGGGTCAIDINGTACPSDERLKTNITDLDMNTLDTLLKVKTVTFNWKEGRDTDTHLGFIAQDIINYFPEVVSTSSNGFYSVNYAGLAPVLVEAIRELDLKLTNMQDLTNENNSFVGVLRTWFASATNGITSIFAGEIHTDKICIGETCIDNEAQLIELKALIDSGATAPPVIPPSDTPIETPPADVPPADDATPPSDTPPGEVVPPVGEETPPADVIPPSDEVTPPVEETPPADSGTPTPTI